ncbi:methyl-accepting chemotaxis protein [Pseudoalteromonas sp. PS5]|nr:methyl-accepting chemotaxis protein [Pseudoalteromonas sp. PS5]
MFITAGIYKDQAFDSKLQVSSRFIDFTSQQSVKELSAISNQLAKELASDRELRKLFSKTLKDRSQSDNLSDLLNDSFERRFHTAGLVNISKIKVYDTEFNFIAASTEGDAMEPTMNAGLKSILNKREGKDKLKKHFYFWNNDGKPYYSAVFPLGGLRIKGYGEIIVDPVHNLKNMEVQLDSAVSILSVNGKELFKSKAWPTNLTGYLVAEYKEINESNEQVLVIKSAFDSTGLISEMGETRNSILAFYTLLGSVFIFVSSKYLKKTLFQPMETMVSDMEAVASGDLSVNIDNYGVKEAHNLSNNLELLVEKLAENIMIIKSNSDLLLSSSNELLQATQKTQDGTTEQQEQTVLVAAAMEEMNATVTDVAASTSQASSSAQESLDKCSDGLISVKSVVKTVHMLSSNILESETKIKRLSEETQDISGILDVISGISAQTNLLALNAAIEAARAGEAGRGFAVVADEVRSLANSTNEAANDIRERVEKLQQGALSAVDSMNESRNSSDQAVKESEETGSSISLVSESVSFMNDVNMQIATAAEEQTAVVTEINQNIVNIKDISDSNLSLADDTAAQSRELVKIAQALRESVKYFKLY